MMLCMKQVKMMKFQLIAIGFNTNEPKYRVNIGNIYI